MQKCIMSNIMTNYTDILNNLLELLSKREQMEIHDYYITTLIKDVCADIAENDIKLGSNINLHILETYLEDCKKQDVYIKGLVITSSSKEYAMKKNYISSVENLINELKSLY